LCQKRECSAPALTATALTDVSASVPPDVNANSEDTVEAISDPAAHTKEAEVMFGALKYFLYPLKAVVVL
jgi:hypothetical protein